MSIFIYYFCRLNLYPLFGHASQELAKLDNVELIQKDGSPCGSKYFLLWNPPLHMTKEGGSKASLVTRRSRYLHNLSN